MKQRPTSQLAFQGLPPLILNVQETQRFLHALENPSTPYNKPLAKILKRIKQEYPDLVSALVQE